MTGREAVQFARNSGCAVGAVFGLACGLGTWSASAGVVAGVLVFLIWPGLLVCGITVLDGLHDALGGGKGPGGE